MGFLILILFLSIAISISLGSASIPPFEVIKIILAKIPLFGRYLKSSSSLPHQVIVLGLRLPRILLCALVGSSLACAGVVMQGLFKNPMASPYVIGVSSGSSFGAALAIFLFSALFSVPLLAFIVGLMTVLLVYRVSQREGRVMMETLLLAGIAVGFFFSALTSFLMYLRAESLHFLVFWIMGGFSGRNWGHVFTILPLVGVGIPVIYCFSRDLNVIQLGEESAANLGVEVERVKIILLVLSSLITAAAVSVSGVIGFVGLIIPHITRILVGPDHRFLIPSSVLIGAIFLVWCDNLARILISPAELPVGVITAFFGAPFFIYLLRKTLSRRER